MQSRVLETPGGVAAAKSLFRSAISTLQPSSLALVGASERAAWPSMIYKNLREFGYGGRIALVNPRQKEVFGERCYPSLRELPEPVDHALVIVPAPGVPDVLRDAEAGGLKSATVYSAMMGDGEEPESKTRGDWLKEFVAGSRLRVAGPNCMGAYSYREKVFGYPNTELCRLEPGGAACIFQSGGNIQFWMKSAADRGLRYSYCITSGNEPDLNLADYLNFVIDDPQTRQVVLFIEGLRNPAAFMHAAGRALAIGKPIMAIKTGVTAKSQAASASHTGAIAGDFEAYIAMCERFGVVNCRSLDDLVETALAFSRARLPKGPRIGFITTSGGTCDLLYDYVEAEGAAMPDFSDATKAVLKPLMQDGISPRNPLDMGIPPPMDVAAKICVAAANDPNIDMVAYATTQPRKEGWGDMKPFRQVLDRTDKPIVGFGRMIHQVNENHLAAQELAGFPFLQGPQPTIRALNALWFFASRRSRVPAPPPPAPASDLVPANLDATLARYGIALPKSEELASAAEAMAAAERIGFPVVLKIRSPDILHKTEAGGVALGLKSRDDVTKAADALVAAARRAYPSARLDGFLVQEMASGVEAIVGARSDALYGPMLLIGAGGVLVELAKDTALRMLPVTADDVRGMVDGLKLAKLLAGFRGRPAADRAALETAALALGRFFLDHRARIADIEINPLMVRASGAVAVDVRVIWRNEGA